MTNKKKLERAVKLLQEVNKTWNEDDVLSYPDSVASFDELVAGIELIRLRGTI